MSKTLIFTIISILFISCNSNSKKQNELLVLENELLQKELEIEKREKELLLENSIKKSPESSKPTKHRNTKYDWLNSDIEEFNKLLNDSNIDVYGNFSFDMGSASVGRIMGNLKSVYLSIEHLPERPGCADICPEMIIIHFRCYEAEKCLTDPAFKEFDNDYKTISFSNIETGKKVYNLLQRIKESL